MAQQGPRAKSNPLPGDVIRIPAQKAIRFQAETAFVDTVRSGS
jgi:nucleoid DNA-binding protein